LVFFFQRLEIKSDIIQCSMTAFKLQLSAEQMKLKIFDPDVSKQQYLFSSSTRCFNMLGLKIFNFIFSVDNCSFSAVMERWIISDLIPNIWKKYQNIITYTMLIKTITYCSRGKSFRSERIALPVDPTKVIEVCSFIINSV